MSSRGKILVQLALKQKQRNVNYEGGMNLTIQGNTIQKTQSTESISNQNTDCIKEMNLHCRNNEKSENCENSSFEPCNRCRNTDISTCDKHTCESSENVTSNRVEETDIENYCGEKTSDKHEPDHPSEETVVKEKCNGNIRDIREIYESKKHSEKAETSNRKYGFNVNRTENMTEKIDENNNSELSSASDIELDYDNDVTDPDWNPPEPKRSHTDKNEHDSTDESDEVDKNEHDSTDESDEVDKNEHDSTDESDEVDKNEHDSTDESDEVDKNEHDSTDESDEVDKNEHDSTDESNEVDKNEHDSTDESNEVDKNEHDSTDESDEVDHRKTTDNPPTEYSRQYKRKQANADNHMKEIQKQKRMKGEQYLGVAKKDDSAKKTYCVERAGRILIPRTCSKRCNNERNEKQQCTKISEDDRALIFEQFWKDMDWKEKKCYVIGKVVKGEVKQRTKGPGDSSRRKNTYTYHLQKGEERIPVCKSMFLSTLGLGEKTVYDWLDNSENGIPNKREYDNRSENTEYKQREESAYKFLCDIPKVESHYCRSESKKKYLEPIFESKSEVYREYVRLMQTEGKNPYYKTGFFEIFEKMNLAIFKPKKDQCDKCCEHDVGNLDEEAYLNHIRKKDEARESKISDKDRAKTDKSVKVLCMDLQSLLICPRLQASSLYYKMKLSCHNFTIYDLTSNEAQNYFWHEGEGELNANVFASCIIDFLDKIDLTDIKEIIIYSDGCTYQNRNTTVSNALLLWAAKKNVIIFQKYLERGHTQMECDSVHSVIERKIRKHPIYVPQMYVQKIEEACTSKPYKVSYVDHSFFKDYESLSYYTSIRPGILPGSPVVTDLRVLRYLPEGKIQYKINYSDLDFLDIPIPKSTRKNSSRVLSTLDSPGNLYTSSLSIKKAKYLHLMQLKSVVPKDYHGFYDNLAHVP